MARERNGCLPLLGLGLASAAVTWWALSDSATPFVNAAADTLRPAVNIIGEIVQGVGPDKVVDAGEIGAVGCFIALALRLWYGQRNYDIPPSQTMVRRDPPSDTAEK